MLVTLLSALPVPRAADHQLIEPARERRLEPKLRQAARELDAGLLGDVFGIRAVTTPFPRKPVDRAVVQVQ